MEREHVSDAFIIHSLILDRLRQSTPLPLSFPHSATHQIDRFQQALKQRNNNFSGPMRPQWNHICDLCSKIVERDGKNGMLMSTFIALV